MDYTKTDNAHLRAEMDVRYSCQLCVNIMQHLVSTLSCSCALSQTLGTTAYSLMQFWSLQERPVGMKNTADKPIGPR